MATQLCDIDGVRPAVASVRIRKNGRVVTRNLCEVHLAEARAGAPPTRRWEPVRRLLFGLLRGASVAGRPADGMATRPRRPVEQIDVTRVLQRRDARALAARGPEGGRVGSSTSIPITCSGLRFRTTSCACRGAGRCRRGGDRGAGRGRGREGGAHRRRAVALAGREGRAARRLRRVARARRLLCRARARPARARRDEGGPAGELLRASASRTRSCAER